MAFVSFELEFNASCATLIGWLMVMKVVVVAAVDCFNKQLESHPSCDWRCEKVKWNTEPVPIDRAPRSSTICLTSREETCAAHCNWVPMQKEINCCTSSFAYTNEIQIKCRRLVVCLSACLNFLFQVKSDPNKYQNTFTATNALDWPFTTF